MNDEVGKSDGGLPADGPLRVDAACDRFEAAWRAGQRPRIEDYLRDGGDDIRLVLAHLRSAQSNGDGAGEG